jgi:hypothetical protein
MQIQSPQHGDGISVIRMKTEVRCIGTIAAQYSRQLFDRGVWLLSGKKLAVPWMKWREIDAIREIIINTRPRNCLEWGAGYSTVYFPEFLSAEASWTSIEHEETWVREVSSRIRRTGIRVHHVPPERYPWTDADDDGTVEDLKSYVGFPSGMQELDFILVDGRARMACMDKATEIVSETGVVVMHDANRTIYRRPFASFPHQAWLLDYRNDSGGLWLGSKARPLNDFLEIDRHRELWRLAALSGRMGIGRLMRI